MVLVAKNSHKKYAHKRDYQFFKNGKSVGHLIIDFKISEDELVNELKEFLDLTGANKIILCWTALEGVVNREVQI